MRPVAVWACCRRPTSSAAPVKTMVVTKPAWISRGFWADWCINGEIDHLPEEEVFKFMTKDPVTVRPATPLADLARQMVDGHIHRLIVVDVQDRPIGVVSSTDILAAVARAALALLHA